MGRSWLSNFLICPDDAAYREWAADFGGVYVPMDKVRPNPYLDVPNRDVSVNGKGFTLINPAYMSRMVFDKVKSK